MMNNRLINWFVPHSAYRSRTNLDMARIFVFTHLAGPLIAQPMAIFLYLAAPQITPQLLIMVIGISGFWSLPFILKYSGNMTLVSWLSFQVLAGMSLFGTYFYGGFSSPFLPWLVVSLLLGFFYLYRQARMVVTLFALNIGVFLAAVGLFGLRSDIDAKDLEILGWLSIIAATVYMTWMALYYARMIALRSELEIEAERYNATVAELEKAREVAEEMSQKRSLFLQKMSHELRTPLNVIIGYSEILLEDSAGDDAGGQRTSDLNRINAAGKHLLSLVSEVLDTETIENGAQVAEISQFSVGELCDHVVASALPVIASKGNQLIIECAEREDMLATDRTKLAQILINLLSNAGKFTSHGIVKLNLRTEKFVADERFIATVSDTGIGIAPEVLPTLFEAYIQADASISRRFGGTGMGLAITRKFAVLLGGEIGVTSKPGEGTTFTVDIPAQFTSAENETPDGKVETRAA